jgi:hypothetical protein
MRVTPGGFRLTFTQPVDPATAGEAKSCAMQCWTCRYHSGYGDPPRDLQTLKVQKATVSDDGLAVALEVEGLKPCCVHELRLAGVRSRLGRPLLHPEAYCTLNRLPK